MSVKCPPILPTVLIADDALLAAQLSTVFAKSGAYLPVIDGPRMARPDRDAEAIRRHNGAVRARAKTIIFAGLQPDAEETLRSCLSKSSRWEVFTSDDAPTITKQKAHQEGDLVWGKERIGIGVLKALRERRSISFTQHESPLNHVPSKSGHLVICEAGEDLSEVIAANYAFALGAGLYIIPRRQTHEAQAILELFYGLNEARDISPTQRLHQLAATLRDWCGDIEIPDGGSITFIADELPYGFAFPEVPSTHLFKYPDLGLAVINGLSREQPKTRGTNVAVLVDPLTTDAPEIAAAAKLLSERNVFVRGYRGPGANVRSISQMIELFPYDLLILATHCGDSNGYRWTYRFPDSGGLNRTLAVDIAIGVGDTGKDDKLSVVEFTRFHSLDGVLWDDPNREDKLYVGTAINDWMEKRSTEDLQPVLKEIIPRVTGSAALKMFDHNYLGLPRSVADKGLPIVINNACASWRELAGRFTFANTRAYVGTLFPVTTSEAHDVVVSALGKNFDKALPHALWSAQNGVYGGSVRRPYVVTGVYPQRLRVTAENVPARILQLMQFALKDWRRSLSQEIANGEEGKRSTSDIVEYYEREVAAFKAGWFGPDRTR